MAWSLGISKLNKSALMWRKTFIAINIKEAIRLILEVIREDLENLNRGKSEVFKVEFADAS